MANKKITDLTELTAVASDDYLEIVDTSANTSKKISRENLIGGGGGGATDHGALTGLGDNDHPQYLLTTAKAADSNRLNGQLGSWYLSTTGKAADSDKLDGLDSTAFGRPVFLAAPLTSIWFDGDSFSTKSVDRIDLGALFGVPAGVKAVLVNIALRDSGSAANECFISLSPSPSVGGMAVRCSGIANDKLVNACLTVPCDTNGDIWYEITTSGTGTMDIYLQIYGYWL